MYIYSLDYVYTEQDLEDIVSSSGWNAGRVAGNSSLDLLLFLSISKGCGPSSGSKLIFLGCKHWQDRWHDAQWVHGPAVASKWYRETTIWEGVLLCWYPLDGGDEVVGVRTLRTEELTPKPLLVSCLDGICFAWPLCPMQSKLLQLLFSCFWSRHLACLGFVKIRMLLLDRYPRSNGRPETKKPINLFPWDCTDFHTGLPMNTRTWIPTEKKHLCSRLIRLISTKSWISLHQ